MFLSPESVPKRWRSRAVSVAMIPLLPSEAAQVLRSGAAEPVIEPDLEKLAALAARGLPARFIALHLGISIRTVYRGLSELRAHFGVASREELVAHLAERGFAR